MSKHCCKIVDEELRLVPYNLNNFVSELYSLSGYILVDLLVGVFNVEYTKHNV